ncbi:inner membrane-spanning protein YciB [Isoalcanivorax indicus]|uniref:inner membrane-spanning protein YciB n=1 Tax=Isoalcanivorax indicus TaxID=2202653 RepID=UPI000DBA1EDB|nr:inner membrane-spanning protein YciB [Isoalcanivorax indicus]
MKKVFDYLPVVVFFALYFLSGRDIYLATWGILIACLVQVSAGWLIWRKVERMHLLVFVVTVIFGGLTLLLRDDVFIKWRPTVIYGLLAMVLLGGQFLRERILLQRMCEAMMITGLGHIVPLSRRHWTILNFAFVLYFSFLGVLNIYVAYQFSTDFWVNFKLIGFTALNFVFYISLFGYVYTLLPEEERNRLFRESGASKGDNTDAQANPEDKG